MNSLYFDNPVVKSLIETPETWNAFYDEFVKTFGRTFRPIKSCYLFLEYIGFTKKLLQIPSELTQPIFEHGEKLAKVNPAILGTINDEVIDLIDKNLSKLVKAIDAYIEAQVQTLQATFEDLISIRERQISSFLGAQELHKVLFGDIIEFMRTDFIGFTKYVTRYLSWDVFCGVTPIGLSLRFVRERQLGYWYQFWEEGVELPAGKIFDDQAGSLDMEFQSHFKNFKDMVDAEMHTYLIVGNRVDHELRPIYAFAYSPHDQEAFAKRNELILGSITRIEQSLNKTLEKRPRKLYQLDSQTHAFQAIFEPIFKILL